MITPAPLSSPPVFLTKSASALLAALRGETLRRAVDGVARQRKVWGAAGGGAALALARPALDAMPEGYRYGKWGARLDNMVSSAVPPEEGISPAAPGKSGTDPGRGRV